MDGVIYSWWEYSPYQSRLSVMLNRLEKHIPLGGNSFKLNNTKHPLLKR